MYSAVKHCLTSSQLWATTKASQTADIMLGEANATFAKFSDGDARFGIWKLKKEPKKFKVK